LDLLADEAIERRARPPEGGYRRTKRARRALASEALPRLVFSDDAVLG
jgi:hypothetical protein